eukprot:jgi/Ulvmu1/6983/UM033_0041.1
MADQLFDRFPMLDAAIVNAVAESFASASGQVDIAQATRALETMLPDEYKRQARDAQELPDSICVVDPMQSFTSAPPPKLPLVEGRRNGTHSEPKKISQKAAHEMEFLFDIFSSLDRAVISSVYQNADDDADAAFTILQRMTDGQHAADGQPDNIMQHSGSESPQHRSASSVSDVPPREYLVQRFPTIPAASIEKVLAVNNQDVDATIAHLISVSHGPGTVAADWFEQHQRDEAFINTLPEDEFKRKLASLRMFLMSDAGRQGGARVISAELIAAALHHCNNNFESAKNLLLTPGVDDLPPYIVPSADAAAEPGVRHLQARLDQAADPGTLSDILNSVDGDIERAVALLREGGAAVRSDIPDAPLAEIAQGGNVRRAVVLDGGSPRKRKAARGADATAPFPGSLPGVPYQGRTRAAQARCAAAAAQPASGGTETRALAHNEAVWWWNATSRAWVEASVAFHNPGQLAVEYTIRLPKGGLIDARRAHLRPRYTGQLSPPPLSESRQMSPPAAALPRHAAAAAAAEDCVMAGREPSPRSSSPILVDDSHGVLEERNVAAAGTPALPAVETWEFRDAAEDNAMRVARELQEEQDRNFALKLAAELPPDAAALPESDDDDNIGLLTGEPQARATQALYDRLNQPVKEMIEQIRAKKVHRDEERAAGNGHAVGQLTFEIQAMEKKREEMQAEVSTRMYRARNRHNREVFTLDLHGLHVSAALERLADKLVHAAGNPSPGRTLLIVITGRGKHSAVKNHSKLREGVGKFLNHADNRRRWNLISVMGKGHFVVELFPAGETPAPLSHSEFAELSNWPSVRPYSLAAPVAASESIPRSQAVRTTSGRRDVSTDHSEASSTGVLSGRLPQPIPADLMPTDPIPADPIHKPFSPPAEPSASSSTRPPRAAVGHAGQSAPTSLSDLFSTPRQKGQRPCSLSPEAHLVQSLLTRARPPMSGSHPSWPESTSTWLPPTTAPPFLAPAPRSAPTSVGPANRMPHQQASESGIGSPNGPTLLFQSPQPRLGKLSDMPLRDHSPLSLRGTTGVGVELYPPDNPKQAGPPEGGKSNMGRGAHGSGEPLTPRTSMLATLFSSHAARPGPVDAHNGLVLSVADCVGPGPHLPPQHRATESDSVMTTNGEGDSRHADSAAHSVPSGFNRDGSSLEAVSVQQAVATAGRLPGHDPPDGMQASDNSESVAQKEDQREAADDGRVVAPLAAQLAKLYC